MLSETRPAKVGKWTEPALRVLRERYLTRQGGEVVETPEEMCWRVALTIARGEARYGRSEAAVREIAEAFYDIMIEGNFLPNSPTLMNAGKGNGLQYSACYVLPVGDSMEEIFDSVKAAAIIHKSGGGTGFAFSRLRPKDDIVKATGGRASGPVSFLRVFNGATEAVKQGGTRRGANMGILRVDHPDILEFIDCKLDGGITNFNISVATTERFMDALEKGEEYDLINPRTNEPVGRLSARQVFERMVRAAWRTGDPGMVFIDRINASPANPTPEIGQIEATNPCGEQPLLPNEACNLGSLNVSKFARKSDDGEMSIDWDEMERVVGLPVRQSGGDRPRRPDHVVREREVARPVREARGRARTVPELVQVHLQRCAPDAELDRHDDRAYGNDLDDRGVLVGHRADLRARVPASGEAAGR